METVLDSLTDACYYLTVERNRYHFSFKENLNKRYADRRANIKDDTIGDRVRTEVQTVFATSNGIAPVFFPENSGKVPDKPALTLRGPCARAERWRMRSGSRPSSTA